MKIFVGVVSKSSDISIFTCQTLLRIQDICKGDGLDYYLEFITNNSLLINARNAMVAKFLTSKYDKLILLDADVGISPNDLLQCISNSYDVVGVSFPRRVPNYQRVLEKKDKINTIDDVRKYINEWIVHTNPQFISKYEETQPYLQVDGMGAALMVLSRDVCQQLFHEYKHLYYEDTFDFLNDEEQKYLVNYFEMELEDGQFYSEDFSFCRKVKRLGYRMFIYTPAKVCHSGEFNYIGSFSEST